MRKRKAVLMAGAALAAGMLSCGLAVRPYLDPASGRYPRSQEVSAHQVTARVGQGEVEDARGRHRHPAFSRTASGRRIPDAF